MSASSQQSTARDRTWLSAAELRQQIRAGEITGPTAGMARGHVQTNVVILPSAWAEEFAEFCRLNPRPCPLVARTERGDPEVRLAAPGSDLRTDVPRYRVFRHGTAEPHEPTSIETLWNDDLVGFLLGCSFTFESALIDAGLDVRHVTLGQNVPMYQTSIACQPAGRFAGPLVVSMRPFPADQVERVVEITGRFPEMHGAPIHVGDPAVIGIADLARPDFGDAVPVQPGEVPLFWACGVTPQRALAAARPPLAITHSPGAMFVTDRKDSEYCLPCPPNRSL